MKYLLSLFLLSLFALVSCDEPMGPNDLAGETNLELTKPGNEYGVYLEINGMNNDALSGIKDSVKITKNENGIVTIQGKLVSDQKAILAIDSLLGTNGLPDTTKHKLVDAYISKYGCKIDTSDHNNMTIKFDVKFKVTSEGVQDFTYSNGDNSKPFTMFKYGSAVGDKYEFTTSTGEKITRTVVQKDDKETWGMSIYLIKTIRVEQETPNDPIIKKVTFIGNHKYGFVGVIHELKSGKIISTSLVPWSVI